MEPIFLALLPCFVSVGRREGERCLCAHFSPNFCQVLTIKLFFFYYCELTDVWGKCMPIRTSRMHMHIYCHVSFYGSFIITCSYAVHGPVQIEYIYVPLSYTHVNKTCSEPGRHICASKIPMHSPWTIFSLSLHDVLKQGPGSFMHSHNGVTTDRWYTNFTL